MFLNYQAAYPKPPDYFFTIIYSGPLTTVVGKTGFTDLILRETLKGKLKLKMQIIMIGKILPRTKTSFTLVTLATTMAIVKIL